MSARFLAFAVCLLVTAPATIAQRTLSGSVFELETENPLPGASVQVEGTFLATVVDAKGDFLIADLSPGEYTLVVRFVGYATERRTVSVPTKDRIIFRLVSKPFIGDEIVVSSTRADESAPLAYTNITQEELESGNLGQDLPILLDQTPSVVTTSDAGAGVGYTGIRIRGSDATRINVTINGVPYNDSESQGTFWVDLPDIVSSTESVQIQRGVGTSTNGAAAFGATINLQTTGLNDQSYARLDNAFGSFATRKHTARFGSGLIGGNWALDGRVSLIQSDGYIDRASSDLRSWYLSAGYFGKRTSLQLLSFTGKERTYQSWYGTPESRINNDEAGMRVHAANNGYSDEQLENLLSSGRTYNYYLYENEVDDYRQDHFQAHISHTVSPSLYLTAAAHYTHGSGYYEQFRTDDLFEEYGLEATGSGTEGDLIRQRWLDNDFYGATYSAALNLDRARFTVGGAYNRYLGDHFGEVIWTETLGNLASPRRYYFSDGFKSDFNSFVKSTLQVTNGLTAFLDGQIRHIAYETKGTDNDQRQIDTDVSYSFFNPKAGLTFQFSDRTNAYASLSIANREPVRNDFVDAQSGQEPLPERLMDWEAGIRTTTSKYGLEINMYHMDYRDQLVLTGELNDVGAPIRVNVPSSYRTGIEIQGKWEPANKFSLNANLSLSRNRIDRFSEVIYDYSEGFDVITKDYQQTDISFSPSVIAGSQLLWRPRSRSEIALVSKAVGRQFLDNTSDVNRSIDPYAVHELRIRYRIPIKPIETAEITLLVRNLFDARYSSSGYTYSYIYGETITENFYYPQAGRHFLIGLSLQF